MLSSLLLILSLAGVAALAHRPGPYQAKSEVTLLPSKRYALSCGGNPYLCLSSSLTLTAGLVIQQVSDPHTSANLASQGYGSSYTLQDDPTTAGPVIDITVTGNNKISVENTLHGVTNEVATKLAQMQAGIPAVDQITSLPVYFDPNPALALKKKARLPAVALAVGLLLTAAVPQMVERLLGRRRRRVAGAADGAMPRRQYDHASDDYVARDEASRPSRPRSYARRPTQNSGDPVAGRPVSAPRPSSSTYGHSR